MARKNPDRVVAPKPTGQGTGNPPSDIPQLTGPTALVFAKMLTVGVPSWRAVLYIVPQLDRDAAVLTGRLWGADKLTHEALADLNGGEWMNLPPEQRYKLALDKNISEAAFYLWSTNFCDTDHAEGLKKVEMARNILKASLGQAPDESDPLAAFSRFAMALTQNMALEDSKKKKAPQVSKEAQADALDKLLSKQPH